METSETKLLNNYVRSGTIGISFTRSEFACRCGCGFDTVDFMLVSVLQNLRDNFKKPVRINSGARCKRHNAAVGGRPRSQHLLGRAADIAVKDASPKEVYEWLDNVYPDCLGLGLYKTFVHVDTRNGKARW